MEPSVRGGGSGGTTVDPLPVDSLARGEESTRKRPQPSVRGDEGRGADLARGGESTPKRARGGASNRKRGRDGDKEAVEGRLVRGNGGRCNISDGTPGGGGTRKQLPVRGDGGRCTITDAMVGGGKMNRIGNGAAALARGGGESNRKRGRDGDTEPSVCGGGTGNIRNAVLPDREMTGIEDDVTLARGGGASNLKRSREDDTKKYTDTSVDTSNTAGPDLIRAAIRTLPPPPDLLISLEKEDDDPVYWALYSRGIEPDNRYRHYVDLYLCNRPEPSFWNEIWKSLPLKLHDAGLLAAVHSVIEFAPGMEGIHNLSSNITRILNNHPGPVSCLRVDSTELPGPGLMNQWMTILTAKLVGELFLLNINLPMDLELPLHHLRSPKLKKLCVGFASIRNCLQLAFGSEKEETHCWASLTELNLASCMFDGSDLSYSIRDLFGLKVLTIGSSNLTVGCDCEGLILASMSLIHLWDCTAEIAVTVGRAPALKYLTVGVKAAKAPSLLIQIDICEDLRYLDRVALHQQDFRLCTGYQTKVQISYY